MKKFLFLFVIAVLVFSIIIPSPVFADNENSKISDPVLVPVVFDGTLYTPEEFNQINQGLQAKGANLIFTINPKDGVFYAFSTINGFNTFAKDNGLSEYIPPDANKYPESTKVEVGGGTVPLQLDKYNNAYHWQNINYSGDLLGVAKGTIVWDLRPYGWNDKISSLTALSNAYPNGPSYLYWDINLGGSVFIVNPGTDIPSLVPYGWNDKISSLMITTEV